MRWIVWMIVAMLGMVSCKSVKYVPLETVKTDSVYLNKLVRDSIYVRDSVYVKEKNDTVFQYKYKYIYKDVAVHDTAYVERVDSIRVPYPVEAQMTRWEKTKMKMGSVAMIVGMILLIVALYKVFHRYKL